MLTTTVDLDFIMAVNEGRMGETRREKKREGGISHNDGFIQERVQGAFNLCYLIGLRDRLIGRKVSVSDN